MTGRVTTCDSPMPYVTFSIYGFLFLALILANVSPASAAAVAGQPGMIKALGQPVGAINSTPSADLLLVRRGGGKGRGAGRGGGGRKAGRGGGGGRREYSGGRGGGRSYRGRDGGGRAYRDYSGGGRSYSSRGRKYPNSRSRRYYYGIPFYGYAPYYGYYSYRPSYGRCDYWSRRCAANWGYGNSNYYGCMRYYGCR